MQAAIKTHLSQPIGVGAFDGQQGISSVIASAVADTDISSVIADIDMSDIDPSDIGPAMTGRANGASTRPAIMKTASSRRMVICRFTPQNPTDAIKLKASRTNDTVMRKSGKRVDDAGNLSSQRHLRASRFKIAREHGRPREKDARLATWLTNTYLQESSMEQQRRPSDPLETILMRVLVISC
jgi:hypothetical protein